MATDQVPIITKEASPVVPPHSLDRSHRVTVISCFLAIYVIWGSTYLAIRYAVESIPPLYTAGLRHLAAGSILLVWCLAKRLRPTWAQIRASIIIGVFFFLIGHGTLHWAEQKVPSGLASLLIAAAEWDLQNPPPGPVVFGAFGAGLHWGALAARRL